MVVSSATVAIIDLQVMEENDATPHNLASSVSYCDKQWVVLNPSPEIQTHEAAHKNVYDKSGTCYVG